MLNSIRLTLQNVFKLTKSTRAKHYSVHTMKSHLLFTSSLLAMTLLLSACITSSHKNQYDDLHHKELSEGLYEYQMLQYDKQAEQFALVQPNDLINQIQPSQNTLILFGEQHAHPGVHLSQYHLLQALAQHKQDAILTMEQFSQDKQSVLDQYLQDIHSMGEEVFTIKAKAWRNYRSDYRPLVLLAQSQNWPVIAANAPSSVVRCINRTGYPGKEQIPTELVQYATLPWQHTPTQKELKHIRATPYYQRFIQHLGKDADQDENNDRLFAAQTVWDASMAEAIMQALDKKKAQVLLHTVGSFHIEHQQGMVSYLTNRLNNELNNTKILTIAPVTGSIEKILEQRDKADILLWVNPLPIAYTAEEKEKYASFHQVEKQEKCDFKTAQHVKTKKKK